MASKKKQRWDVGDVFLLPLKDGTACIGQVIGREPSALNSVAIALYDIKGGWKGLDDFPELRLADIFSAILVTKDYLDGGGWKVVAREDVDLLADKKPYEHLRAKGFIGAKIRGSELVEDFANAFYGLAPWDDWYVPDYLDGYLISPDKKPVERLIFSGRHG